MLTARCEPSIVPVLDPRGNNGALPPSNNHPIQYKLSLGDGPTPFIPFGHLNCACIYMYTLTFFVFLLFVRESHHCKWQRLPSLQSNALGIERPRNEAMLLHITAEGKWQRITSLQRPRQRDEECRCKDKVWLHFNRNYLRSPSPGLAA